MGEKDILGLESMLSREDMEVIEGMLFFKEYGDEKLVPRGKREKEAVERFYDSSKRLFIIAVRLKEELAVNTEEYDSKLRVAISVSVKELLLLRFAVRMAFDFLGNNSEQFRKYKAMLEDFMKRTDYLVMEESKNDV